MDRTGASIVTADIVLWLDLAESNQVAMMDEEVRRRVPEGARVLRLTDYGAVRCAGGTPQAWRPVLDSIERLVRDAQRLEGESPGVAIG
jgi:hypothetical protein